MYAYIKGELISRGAASAVIENSGIGYDIQMSPNLLSRIGQPGDAVKVFLYLYVKEDAMQLFGFADREQQALFQTLIGVSGIGPKLALAILDALPPDRFALAVVNRDIKTLTGVKGLGKKGAERLVLEIQDKVGGLVPAVDAGGLSGAAAAGTDAGTESALRADVTAALLMLGYTAGEVQDLLKRSFDEALGLEMNIQRALQATLR